MPGPIQDGSNIRADGSLNFSSGVDSVLVTTVQSQLNPNGLSRSQLAWGDNITVRDGGISPRGGYSLLAKIHDGNALFQGGFMYEPIDSNPYMILCLSGHTYQVVPGPPFSITELSTNPSLLMPATQPQFFFVQAEQFLVIQAGDNVTLPLFWDGATLRRSKGITNTAVAPGTPGVNELPAATAMDYYMGRIWYGQGRRANAGDMVDGPSGTPAYRFADSVLNVTENPLVLGGDGFAVPAQSGAIRSIFHNGQLNSQLGQGNLFIGTRTAIYSLNVPVSRADWIAANNSNQPLMTVALINNGTVNDRSIVQVNGDPYFQSLEPSIRSLFSAVRYFNQPGQIEISAQETRLLQFNDRSLLRLSSGMFFDNRLLETALPKQLPQGVVHTALAPLDFVPMSTFGSNQQPIWEGSNSGLQLLQLFSGDFGGLERGFGVSVSTIDSAIELWEFGQSGISKFDSNRTDPSARINWFFETPAFTWGDEFALKKLVSGELWIDRLYGTVVFQMQYRPGGESCWIDWHQWTACSQKNSEEDCNNPIAYPLTEFGPGYRTTMVLPKPPERCESPNQRPSTVDVQFQCRLNVKGYCRVRGLLLWAERLDRSLYTGLVC
jgi:hypothetical protein